MKSKGEELSRPVSRHKHPDSYTRRIQPARQARPRALPTSTSLQLAAGQRLARLLEVDILHAMGVEYLQPEGDHDSTLPEPHRTAPRHARPAHPADPPLGPAARLRHQP